MCAQVSSSLLGTPQRDVLNRCREGPALGIGMWNVANWSQLACLRMLFHLSLDPPEFLRPNSHIDVEVAERSCAIRMEIECSPIPGK